MYFVHAYNLCVQQNYFSNMPQLDKLNCTSIYIVHNFFGIPYKAYKKQKAAPIGRGTSTFKLIVYIPPQYNEITETAYPEI